MLQINGFHRVLVGTEPTTANVGHLCNCTESSRKLFQQFYRGIKKNEIILIKTKQYVAKIKLTKEKEYSSMQRVVGRYFVAASLSLEVPAIMVENLLHVFMQTLVFSN